MTDQIVLRAEFRENLGTGASRRLRRLNDQVPGILYGGGMGPVPIAIPHRELAKAIQEEAFFSRVLDLAVGDKTQSCVLRDLQRHPVSERVQHVDFLRVREDVSIQMHVPLRYVNEEQCVGVRLGGGRLARNLIEVEISCLPRDLPEFIEVDVAALQVGESLHLSELALPSGVAVVALALGAGHDAPVVTVSARRGGMEEDDQATEDEAPAEEEI